MNRGEMTQPEIPSDPVADLVSVLDLEQIAETEFLGRTQWMPHGRVFGGQVLAQALTAATRTIDPTRHVHSLHSYFLRPGDIEKDIRFSVEILRDGKSFSARRVHALQDDKPIFSMIASFQEDSPGLEHSESMPENVPAPETLPSAADLLGKIDHPAARYWSSARPFDLRHVTEPVYLTPAKQQVANQMIWFRSLTPMPTGFQMHAAALAYASDYSILESILKRHGLSWAHPGLSSASLDHAMWFHRPTKVDQWHLYVQESPSAQGGRGLSIGKIFDQQGNLVASVAQEGMVRIPELS
jgi:acyl-CoA thioesterase-2